MQVIESVSYVDKLGRSWIIEVEDEQDDEGFFKYSYRASRDHDRWLILHVSPFYFDDALGVCYRLLDLHLEGVRCPYHPGNWTDADLDRVENSRYVDVVSQCFAE